MAENEKGKKFLEDVMRGKEGDPRPFFNQMRGNFICQNQLLLQ